MKKKTVKKGLLLLAAILILAAGIVTVLWFYRGAVQKKAAENAADQFMQAYIQQDSAGCEQLLLNGGSEPVEFSEAQKVLSQTITYKILGSERVDSDAVAVNLEIENVDFSKIMEDITTDLQGELTESDIVAAIGETANQAENRKVYPCEVLVYCGEEEKIAITSNFSNALLGGFNEYLTFLLSEKEET